MQRTNMKKKLTLCQWLGLTVFIFALMQFLPTSLTAADKAGNEQFETCAECHEDLAVAFKKGSHAAIDKKGLAKHAGAKSSCTSCHGDVKKHLDEAEAGNVFAFKAENTANSITKRCLACHKDDHADYFRSPHGKASLSCTSCHGVHKKKKVHATKSCWTCHEDVFSKFQLNESHRLREGTIGCGDCHDPHKPAARERLGGFKQETCFKCHTDKEGPFLHEHASVAIEGCTVCHDAHGSPNRHQLIDQSVSRLCYSCHTVVPGWHSRFTNESNCVSCHSTIHGSNFSSKFLK